MIALIVHSSLMPIVFNHIKKKKCCHIFYKEVLTTIVLFLSTILTIFTLTLIHLLLHVAFINQNFYFLSLVKGTLKVSFPQYV